MKKVFFITLGSLFIVNMLTSQTVAAISPEAGDLELKSEKRVINDIRAVDEIREHLLNDSSLQRVINNYVDRGYAKVAVTVDKSGRIQDVTMIESLSMEHDKEIINSIKRIRSVNPIKIDGKVVKQKVVLPIYFQ